MLGAAASAAAAPAAGAAGWNGPFHDAEDAAAGGAAWQRLKAALPPDAGWDVLDQAHDPARRGCKGPFVAGLVVPRHTPVGRACFLPGDGADTTLSAFGASAFHNQATCRVCAQDLPDDPTSRSHATVQPGEQDELTAMLDRIAAGVDTGRLDRRYLQRLHTPGAALYGGLAVPWWRHLVRVLRPVARSVVLSQAAADAERPLTPAQFRKGAPANALSTHEAACWLHRSGFAWALTQLEGSRRARYWQVRALPLCPAAPCAPASRPRVGRVRRYLCRVMPPHGVAGLTALSLTGLPPHAPPHLRCAGQAGDTEQVRGHGAPVGRDASGACRVRHRPRGVCRAVAGAPGRHARGRAEVGVAHRRRARHVWRQRVRVAGVRVTERCGRAGWVHCA